MADEECFPEMDQEDVEEDVDQVDEDVDQVDEDVDQADDIDHVDVDAENDTEMNCEDGVEDASDQTDMNESEPASVKVEDEAIETEETAEMEANEQTETPESTKPEKKGRTFIPSQLEFKSERTREQQERTVIIGPATLDDLFQSRIKDYMPHSEQFYIRYLNTEVIKKDTSEETGDVVINGDPPVKEHRGLVEVRFPTIEEAENAVQELAGLHDGLIVKRITYEFAKTPEFKTLKKIGQPYDSDGLDGFAMRRVVALVGIDDNIKLENIKEKIPEAIDAMFPNDYVKNERKSYCYIEMKTLEDVKSHLDKSVSINDKEYSIVALEEIPPLEFLTKKLDRENIPDYLQFPLDKVKKDRIRTLLRQTNHHKRLDGISDAKLDMIKKKTHRFEALLKQDFQLRRGRGGRGRGRGGEHRGGRGSMRGSAPPPPHYNYYPPQSYPRYDAYDDYYAYDSRRRGVPERLPPRQYGYGGGPPPSKRRMNDNYWY